MKSKVGAILQLSVPARFATKKFEGSMAGNFSMPEQILRVLVIGEDSAIEEWFGNTVSALKLPWKVQYTCRLRFNAPEYHLKSQDLVVLIWDKLASPEIETIIPCPSVENLSPQHLYPSWYH